MGDGDNNDNGNNANADGGDANNANGGDANNANDAGNAVGEAVMGTEGFFDDDDGFSNYEPTTIDPGKEALLVTAVASVLMILLIPFFIAVREQIRSSKRRRKWKKEKENRKNQKMEAQRKAKLIQAISMKRDMSELYRQSQAVETQAMDAYSPSAIEDSLVSVVEHDHADQKDEKEFPLEEDEIKKMIPTDLLDDDHSAISSTGSETSSGTYGVEREDAAYASADNETTEQEIVIDAKDFLKGPSRVKAAGRRLGATSRIVRGFLRRRDGKTRFGLKNKNNHEEATVATAVSDEADIFDLDDEAEIWEDELLEAFAVQESKANAERATDYHTMEDGKLPASEKQPAEQAPGYVQMVDDTKPSPARNQPDQTRNNADAPGESSRIESELSHQPSITAIASVEMTLSQSSPRNEGDYVMMQHQHEVHRSFIDRLKRKPSRATTKSFVRISAIDNAKNGAEKMHNDELHSETPVKGYLPTKTSSSSEDEEEPDFQKRVNVDVCCGPQPWWNFLCSKHFWHKVTKCASYDREMKALLKLALPFTIHSLYGHILGLCEIAVIGRLLGTQELSAYYTVDFVFSLSTMFLEGFHSSLYTLCSHAVGARKYHLAGQYIQLSIIMYQLLLIPCAFAWWWWLDDVIYWLGFEEDVVDISVDYAMIAVWMYFLGAIDDALSSLLEICGYQIYTSILGMVGDTLSFVSVLLYALYAEPTLRGIGIVHLSLQIFFMVLNIIITSWCGWLQPYLSGMIGSIAFYNGKAMKAFFKTSTPLAFGYIMAYGEWEVLFVFAGLMGPAEVAVWGLLGSIWEAIEEVGLATADAAEVRVANLLGSAQPKRARYSSHKALFVGVVLSLMFTVPVFLLRDRLPAWFTSDETLQAIFATLIPYICVGNITMMFGSMSWTLLGAQGRFGLATLVGFIGSWGVTLPLSAISTMVMNYDLQAMTGAVVIGYACSGSVNSYFLLRSNWEKISKKVQKRNREAEENPFRHGKYDTIYWKDLPLDVQEAARLLGFDRRIWNNDKEPDTYALPFDELDAEQQKAALLVGFTKETWGISSEQEDYNEYDWDELPEDWKEAATVLGYTEDMWDNETGEPFTSDLAWDELTPAQQEAAALFGYRTAEQWNEG